MSKTQIILNMWLTTILGLLFLQTVLATSGGLHQDSRCNCVCPDTNSIEKLPDETSVVREDEKESFSDKRTVYINSSVTPDECTCQNVVLVHMNLTDAQADSFCPRYVQ